MKQPPDIQVKEDQPEPKPWLRCDPELKLSMLNLQEVVNDWTVHQFIRKVAGDMMLTKIPYTSTGSIFYAMPNYAVADLAIMAEGFEDHYSEWLVSQDLNSVTRLKNLTLFAFLIARCEGLPDLAPKVIMEALPNLVALLKLEQKYRQGLANVNYLQYSLFDVDKLVPGGLKKKPKEDPPEVV
jgi:hypothetical protein